MNNLSRSLIKLAASLAVSFAIIGFLFQLLGSDIDQANRPQLLDILSNSILVLVGIRLVLYLCEVFFRTIRFRLLILATDSEAPSFFQLGLITFVRNMTVDLLPARLGELAYVAMLKKGCNIPASVGLSSLSISFMFDMIALLFLIAVIVVYQLGDTGIQGWIITAAIGITVLCGLIYLFLFNGIGWVSAFLSRQQGRFWQHRFVSKTITLGNDISEAIEKTRTSGNFFRILVLSFIVRTCKYSGILLLFYAVILINFPEFKSVGIANVLTAMIAGEGAASLPVPTFMSFGTYEAGGVLVLTALGFSGLQSLLTMLAIHVWSQLTDYLLGGIALILFFYTTRQVVNAKQSASRFFTRKNMIAMAAIGVVLVSSLGYLGLSYRSFNKMGAISAPESGDATLTRTDQENIRQYLETKSLDGFVTWSSNRNGSHEIYTMDLTTQEITQITDTPYVEFFPRVSPDGTKIAFARSHQEWVSQRNTIPWDVYIYNLETGQETLVANKATVPTWADDSRFVYYLHNARNFVKHDLETGNREVLYQSGEGDILNKANFYHPSYNSALDAITLTAKQSDLRMNTGHWGTAILTTELERLPVYNGCQLFWSTDGSYILQVGKGGHQINAFYKTSVDERKMEKWLDLPGEFSHEYFPKVSNDDKYLVFGASRGDHEHDTADYEIFLWEIDTPAESAIRLTFHTGNDNWPDIYIR